MRSPQHNPTAPHRAGRELEPELHLHYLAPGAFTILPPDNLPPPDPPSAPQPYRLANQTTRRNRNQAFSIIAESSSRSSSPTGRVSPFRGRGFNPAGSRHASPNPSPPPEDIRQTPSPRHVSKIPTLSRRPSNVLGEKVSHLPAPRRRFHSQHSQSLSDLEQDKTPIAKKTFGYNRPPAFQQLSPIAGSSPEPSQSLSSPSRIPKSRSQPGSRITSPARTPSGLAAKPPISRPASRNQSRNQSRNVSRETSPVKIPTSPTRIPVSKYRNVQAKVNSFSSKPKVPPKPQNQSEQIELTEQTEDSDAPKSAAKPNVVKRDSVRRQRTTKPNVLAKTSSISNIANVNNNNKTHSGSEYNQQKVGTTIVRHPSNKRPVKNVKSSIKKEKEKEKEKEKKTDNETSDLTSAIETHESELSTDEVLKESESVLKLTDLTPSTTAVVSSTTTTITQPLKIDAKIDPPLVKYDKPKPVSPMVDGRVLSATSVSNAINRMNDTVLNTQTVIKDHGFSKSSPAATIVSMANETKPENPAVDTKNLTTALPTIDTTATVNKPKEKKLNNHVTSVGISEQNHVSPDHPMGNSVQKSVNDRIKEARTVVAADVKPIKIMVQEKPSDVEVQSGNVRIPVSATNGLSERPSLPPTNHTPPNEPEPAKPSEKTNACTRFLSTCRSKIPCKCCKKETEPQQPKEEQNEDDAKTGCFNCRKKKPDQVQINIEPQEDEPKKKFLDRLKCCGKNKVGDRTGWFSKGKRKESWAQRRDSILSDPPLPKSKCSRFMRKMFCLDLCCKKKLSVEEQMSRKASMMSKKKSLTPTTMPPPEDTKPKLDLSLVEYTSAMKGAIPVLPVSLAWFCLVMNCIAPGSGTVFSGMFCLCLGKPRFSQKDGPKQRIGAFIINIFIGAGQFFTVLFCLVGWGWSIWWGVIMIKIAKKHRKIKQMEAMEEAAEQRTIPSINQNHRDAERGS